MEKASLGVKIRKYRIARNLSQMDLELKTDLAFGSISRIESGKINPTKETINKIAEALNLDSRQVADLMELEYFSPIEIVKAINEISKCNNLQDLLQKAVDVVFDLYEDYNGALLVLLDESGNFLKYGALTNNRVIIEALKVYPKVFSTYKIPMETESNLFVESINDNEVKISRKLSDFGRGAEKEIIVDTYAKISGFKIGVAIPIIQNGKAIGSIIYTKREDKEFSNEELTFLTLLNDQIGIAIENLNKH